MTPKERATELVEKYKDITIKYVLNGEANEGDVNDEAKECASIAVQEIIEAIEMFGYSSTFYDHEETGKMTCVDDEPPTMYWNKVKNEINKL
jgi:hypothetical protein